jgi:formate dehydrogenase gamma subunit
VFAKGDKRVAIAVLLVCTTCIPAATQDDQECLFCHGEPDLTDVSAEGTSRSLYVDETVFTNSLHGPLGCIGCHADISELPHAEKLLPADCSVCHDQSDEYAKSLHGQALSRGDPDAATCSDCHAKHNIRNVADPLSPVNRRNLPQTCGQCHADPQLTKRHMIGVQDPTDLYLQSVHGRSISTDPSNTAASCTDCHGTHTMLPAHQSDSRVFPQNIPNTCGQCHPEILTAFSQSIHGRALQAGIKDAPNCTDCHGEHNILEHDAADSPVNTQTISQATCVRCHNDERIMKQYGITAIRTASYMDSYHGIAIAGAETVANCTSCHGVHAIREIENPSATVHPQNLPQTCGQCHENADQNFASGAVHTIKEGTGQRALEFVRVAYLAIIAAVIGTMLLHNALLMFRHLAIKFKQQSPRNSTARRFSTGQRLGHAILALSFIFLTASGFALRYPEAWWAQLLFLGDTGLALRSEIHRIAGAVLMLLILFHLIHALTTRKGQTELRAMLPKKQDLKDAKNYMRYAIGTTPQRPQFARYNYTSKIEYWGLIWGSILMSITGICMWYADIFLAICPKVVLDVLALIHFYEACLAALTILVWHLYFVVLSPDSYPMDWAWLTGRITKKEHEKQHPRE